jgi:hypothetical protein
MGMATTTTTTEQFRIGFDQGLGMAIDGATRTAVRKVAHRSGIADWDWVEGLWEGFEAGRVG